MFFHPFFLNPLLCSNVDAAIANGLTSVRGLTLWKMMLSKKKKPKKKKYMKKRKRKMMKMTVCLSKGSLTTETINLYRKTMQVLAFVL